MKLKPVNSVYDLNNKARVDANYARLASLASANLGGPKEPLQECLRWLNINAAETDEDGVVDEINFCIDLV